MVAPDHGLVGEQPWRLCNRLDITHDRYRCYRAQPLARLAGSQPRAPSTVAHLSRDNRRREPGQSLSRPSLAVSVPNGRIGGNASNRGVACTDAQGSILPELGDFGAGLWVEPGFLRFAAQAAGIANCNGDDP